jgi:hypothetical protein
MHIFAECEGIALRRSLEVRAGESGSVQLWSSIRKSSVIARIVSTTIAHSRSDARLLPLSQCGGSII